MCARFENTLSVSATQLFPTYRKDSKTLIKYYYLGNKYNGNSMVSLHKVIVASWLIISEIKLLFRFKRGASSDARSTIQRLSHCPVSWNEQCRKPHADEYIMHTQWNIVCWQWPMRAVYKHPKGRPHCFAFN